MHVQKRIRAVFEMDFTEYFTSDRLAKDVKLIPKEKPQELMR